jgi:Holliday junction DNA helicase RuvB
MGKTTLARAVAKEMGVACKVVHGRAKPEDLCDALVRLQKGDLLFLDEAHSLPRESQECLFEVIDNGTMVDLWRDTDPNVQVQRDKDGRLIIAPITVVLATDQPGKLLDALSKRMEHRVFLHDYSVHELKEIIAAVSSERGLLLSTQAMGVLARASQAQPRRAVNYLMGMRREYAAQLQRQFTADDVRKYLQSAGTDELGISPEQQTYMTKLQKLGKASLATLAGLLGSDAGYVQSEIEPGLVKLDFVHKSTSGRVLTQGGRQWVQQHITGRAKNNADS